MEKDKDEYLKSNFFVLLLSQHEEKRIKSKCSLFG